MLDRTRFGIGGNYPPEAIDDLPEALEPHEIVVTPSPPDGPIDRARTTLVVLSTWMDGHPIIETEAQAQEGKALIERARGSLDAMETERDGLVRPLNQQVKDINGRYKPTRTAIETLVDLLTGRKGRLTAYADRLEAERIRLAREAQEARDAAEKAAREAEAKEREAIENANQGECDTNIGQATVEADEAFEAFRRADHAAQRAERATTVKIGGGYGNRLGFKKHEVLTVSDWKAAITDMSQPDGILPETLAEAIATAARAHRKAFGDLPAGIIATNERSL